MVSCGMWKMIIIVYNLLSPVTALPTPSAGYYYDTTTIDYDVADFDEFGIDPGVTDYSNYDNPPGNQDSQPVDAAYDYSIGYGAGTGPDYLGPPFEAAAANSVIDGVNPVPTPGVVGAMSEEGDDGPNGVQSPDDNYYNDNADENASPDENTTQYPDFAEYTTGSSIVEKQPNSENAGTDGSTSADSKMSEATPNSGYATPLYTTTAFDIHSGKNGEFETSNNVNVNTNNVSGKMEIKGSVSAHEASDNWIENENEVNGTAESTVFAENTERSSVNMQDGTRNSDSIEPESNSAVSNENTSSVESYNSAESPDATSNSMDSLGSDSLEIRVLNDSVSGTGSNSLSGDQESLNSSPESRESRENIISSGSNGIDRIENSDNGGNNSESSQSIDFSSAGSESSPENSNEFTSIGTDSTESNADSSLSVTESDESSSSSASTASKETSIDSSNVESSSSESVSKDSGIGDSENNSSGEDTVHSNSVQSDESTDNNKSGTVDKSAKSTSESTESVSSDSPSLSSASSDSRSQSSEEENSIEQCFQESDTHHDLCALVRSIKMVCMVHFPKDCFLKQSFPWSSELDTKDNSSTSAEESVVDSTDSKSGSKSDSISKAFSEETFELESLSASFENVGGIAELMSLIRNSCPIICHASDKVARELNSIDTDGDSDESDDVDDDADNDVDDDLDNDDDESTEYDDENDTDDYESAETDPDDYSSEEYEDSLDGKSGVGSVNSEDDLSNIGKKIDESDSEESLNVSVPENSEGRASFDTSVSSTEMSTDNESNREETRSIVTYSSMESPDNTNSISDAISDEDN